VRHLPREHDVAAALLRGRTTDELVHFAPQVRLSSGSTAALVSAQLLPEAQRLHLVSDFYCGAGIRRAEPGAMAPEEARSRGAGPTGPKFTAFDHRDLRGPGRPRGEGFDASSRDHPHRNAPGPEPAVAGIQTAPLSLPPWWALMNPIPFPVHRRDDEYDTI
jgi:hypothetical protein